MLNGEPCDTDCLEGVNGYIYIDTKNFLRENNLRYNQVIIPNMEHRSPADKIDEILKISNYLK